MIYQKTNFSINVVAGDDIGKNTSTRFRIFCYILIKYGNIQAAGAKMKSKLPRIDIDTDNVVDEAVDRGKN